MRKSKKRSAKATPVKGRRSTSHFGGRGTARGVGYEGRVAALIATKMLSGDRSAVWDGVNGADITAITMQAPEAVDDIVISLGNDAKTSVYLSAKNRGQAIAMTARSAAFVETVDAFVRQFVTLPPKEALEDRFLWVVPSSAGKTVSEDLCVVLNLLREDAGDAGLATFLRNRQQKHRKALESFINQTKKCWKEIAGNLSSESELTQFLKCVHVVVYEFESGQHQELQAQSDLRSHILAEPRLAKRAWKIIVQYFAGKNEHGLRATSSSLRSALSEEGISLKCRPDYADDCSLLDEISKRNQVHLKKNTVLRFGSLPSDSVHIKREDVLSALLKAIKAGHLLLTGEPGCGKSGLIHAIVEEFRREKVPIVLLLAEEVFGGDQKAGVVALNLKHSLDDILANWPNGSVGILITDALDALRDVEMQKKMRRLLLSVKDGRCGWKVIASVREFDLKHGRELREMFSGAGVPGHSSNEFSGVAHFHLKGVSQADIDELVKRRPEIGPFIRSARENPKSREIHQSPFFLHLAAELLADGVTPSRLADWNSPAVLLRKFWERRIEDGKGAGERSSALATICRRMLDTRSMRLSIKELNLGSTERDSIHELRGRGILLAPHLKQGMRIGEETIGFSHHLLHDYAIARSLIPAIPERFTRFAIAEPLLPVFYRQSFMFALEELWDGIAGPEGFWACALELEGVKRLHGISRILAPILAARRAEVFADLEPLIVAIAASQEATSPACGALRHLAAGLQDASAEAVKTGLSAWCSFAAQLASHLVTHPFIEGPLVLILARLVKISESIAYGDRRAMNNAGKSLLSHYLKKDYGKGWRYAASTAMEVVCRTFDVSPKTSEEVLLSALDPHRIQQLPHYDLFDLAQSIEHLGDKGETVIRRLFDAAFSAEPNPGQWENFGGAILPLRMQTSDHWNSIHYSLAGYYEGLTGQNAPMLTEIACIAWNAVVRRRRGQGLDDVRMATLHFRGVACDLFEDAGHIWEREYEHEENRILSHFEQLLQDWAVSGDKPRLEAALDRAVSCNRNSVVWSVFMETGSQHPSTLGYLLEELLGETLFLTHPDYCRGGVALLGALHQMEDNSKRERLEKLILELPLRARFFRDEPRNPTPAWLEHAQNRALGSLKQENIVLPALRELWIARKASNNLVSNYKRARYESTFSQVTEEERLALEGVDLKKAENDKLFRLRESLKPLVDRTGDKRPSDEIVEQGWKDIQICERALKKCQKPLTTLAAELWGHVVGACESVARYARWKMGDKRWMSLRKILLIAASDPHPKATADDESKEDKWPCWGWPSPRLDCARSLPILVSRLGRADNVIAAVLRGFCKDKSHALRFNFADRLVFLEQPAPKLMWELIDTIILQERKFSVIESLLFALDRLWARAPSEVMTRLRVISSRALQESPSNKRIFERLAGTHLFQYFRTGDLDCEAFIQELISKCDFEYASHALLVQLHSCRGWLIAGDAVNRDEHEDAVRARAWTFLQNLLSAAQAKLREHRDSWQRLHDGGEPSEAAKALEQEAMRQTSQLVDGIATQLFFTSGAYAEEHPQQEREGLSHERVWRFWKDAESIFDALSTEAHPHTVHHLVQTFRHLLPCAPTKVFLLAMQAICNSAEVGFQNESLAVPDVVKLIQRALADHRDIFTNTDGSESQCLEVLLKVLDIFVEAGWPEARQLTHRLEDVYK